MPKPFLRPASAFPSPALTAEVKNPKENSEKMKIVNFLHFHFTMAQNPIKTPITGKCDRG
jgi:hypothetical protein